MTAGYKYLNARVDALSADGKTVFATLIPKKRRVSLPRSVTTHPALSVGMNGFYVEAETYDQLMGAKK